MGAVTQVTCLQAQGICFTTRCPTNNQRLATFSAAKHEGNLGTELIGAIEHHMRSFVYKGMDILW
jgi:hypothetical protein